MRKIFAKFEAMKDEKGATMIEYTLLAALISIVALLAITGAGGKVNTLFETVQSAIP